MPCASKSLRDSETWTFSGGEGGGGEGFHTKATDPFYCAVTDKENTWMKLRAEMGIK